MDTLNIIFGIVGLFSFIFSLWVYVNKENFKRIENEKINSIRSKISTAIGHLSGISQHVGMIVVLSKRNNTTLDEMRHISICIATDLNVARAILRQEEETLTHWRFGKTSEYLSLKPFENDAKKDDADL